MDSTRGSHRSAGNNTILPVITVTKAPQESRNEQDMYYTKKQRQVATRIPQLYLELLENKDKVRQELVNQDYRPEEDETMSDISYFRSSFLPSHSLGAAASSSEARPGREDDEDLASRDDSESQESEDQENDGHSMTSSEARTVPDRYTPRPSSRVDRSSQEVQRQKEDMTDDEEEEEDEEDHDEPAPHRSLEPSYPSLSSSHTNVGWTGSHSPPPVHNRTRPSLSRSPSKSDSGSSLQSEPLHDPLLSSSLPPTASGMTGTIEKEGGGRVAPPRNESRHPYDDILEKSTPAPPTLTDLQKTGEIRRTNATVPDIQRMYTKTKEEEEDMKREILFKFELLKKSYKNMNIPDYTVHTDLKQMTRSYEQTVRRVSLDSTVDQYKSFLIGGFMVMETIFGSWFKFDMNGFTQQQISQMNQYERLLIELGEKTYTPGGGSSWPVEIRLLSTVFLNTIIFIICRFLFNKTGTNIMTMMNQFLFPNHQKPPSSSSYPTDSSSSPTDHTFSHASSSPVPPPPRKGMRGPSINPNEIPDLS